MEDLGITERDGRRLVDREVSRRDMVKAAGIGATATALFATGLFGEAAAQAPADRARDPGCAISSWGT